MPNIVVIGGVAAGSSAASQAKRRQPDADVVLLERGPFASYGACGIPYNLQDPARRLEDLIAVSAEDFRAKRNIDLRTRHEVRRIDVKSKQLVVRDLEREREYSQPYDKLVIATGAVSTPIKVSGAELPGVFALRELTDGENLKRYLADRQPKSALIVGGGYIAMEMAETLRARGLRVRILEKSAQLLSGFDREIVELVDEELRKHEVEVKTGVTLRAIERLDRSLLVHAEDVSFDADLVLIAAGIRPNVALAKEAGIRLGETGAIAVDAQQRTQLEDIFAAGDCAEALNVVSGRPTWVPLGTTANKQGKIAGANASGANESFHGIVATGVFKSFDLEVARTGLLEREIQKLGLDGFRSVSEQPSRANSYGGDQPVHTVLFAERGSQRLLGAQMAGRDGAGLRIDVFATALHAKMTLSQIESLDLAYAPPFAPVYDPVLIAALVARKDAKS